MLTLKPLGWQSPLIHSPLGQQSALGGTMPLGTTTETIAQTFPILQLALDQRESSSEPDQTLDWSDWNWDSSSKLNDATPSSSASLISEPQLSETSSPQFAQPDPISGSEAYADTPEDPPAPSSAIPSTKLELLHPQIARKPLGAASPLGNREPLEPIEPIGAAEPFSLTEPVSAERSVQSSIQRDSSETPAPSTPSVKIDASATELVTESAVDPAIELATGLAAEPAIDSIIEPVAEPEPIEPQSKSSERISSNITQEPSPTESSTARLEAETDLATTQSIHPSASSLSNSERLTDTLSTSVQANQELSDSLPISRSTEETAIFTDSTHIPETSQPSLANQISAPTDSAQPTEQATTPLSSSSSVSEPTASVTADSTAPLAPLADWSAQPSASAPEPSVSIEPADLQVEAPVQSSDSVTPADSPVQSFAESSVQPSIQPSVESIATPISESTISTAANLDSTLTPELNSNLLNANENVDQSTPIIQSAPILNDSSTTSPLLSNSLDETSEAELVTHQLPESPSELSTELPSELANLERSETAAESSTLETAIQSSSLSTSESISELTPESTYKPSISTKVDAATNSNLNSVSINTDEYSAPPVDASEPSQFSEKAQTDDTTSSWHQVQPASGEDDSAQAALPNLQTDPVESSASFLQSTSVELQQSSHSEAELQPTESIMAPEQALNRDQVGLSDEFNSDLSQLTDPVQKFDSDLSQSTDSENVDQTYADESYQAESDQATEPTSITQKDSITQEGNLESTNPQTLSETENKTEIEAEIEKNEHQTTAEPLHLEVSSPDSSAPQNIQLKQIQPQTPASAAQPIPDSWSSLSELIAPDAESAPWQETLDSLDAIAQPDLQSHAQPDLQSEALPSELQDKEVGSTDLPVDQTLIQARADPSTAATISSDSNPDSKPADSPPQSPTDEQLDQIATIIYSQLRRQFVIDRERQGDFLSGHTPWLGEVIVAERAGTKSITAVSTEKSRKQIIDVTTPNAALEKLIVEIHTLLKRQIELERERSVYF